MVLFYPPILTALITMVLVINNSSNVIQGLSDLPGHTVIVPRGTTGEAFMRTQAGIQTIVVDSVVEMFQKFADGQGDALVYDWPTLNSFINEQAKAGSTVSYELVGNVFQEQQYGIAISGRIINSSSLMEAFNKAILETWETDRFKLLETRWINEQAISLDTQVQNSNTQLVALLITGSFVFGFGLIVTLVYFMVSGCCCTKVTDLYDGSKSIRSLGNDIKNTLDRQKRYAKRLPPNTLTYANWEMLSSIANFLKEWRPVKKT